MDWGLRAGSVSLFIFRVFQTETKIDRVSNMTVAHQFSSRKLSCVSCPPSLDSVLKLVLVLVGIREYISNPACRVHDM